MAHPKRGVVWEALEHPRAFALTFVGFFVLAFIFLSAVDALPDPAPVHSTPAAYTVAAQDSAPEAPVRIVASAIGLDASVANPTSIENSALDEGLLHGAVRYPTSAMLGVNGTVLLFGHSSYLPIVHNQAYKTFDGIQNLKVGEIVSVYSQDREYRYTVAGVRLANANEDVVELQSSGKHLALVTCNSFAEKSARFVVTADLEGVYKAAN